MPDRDVKTLRDLIWYQYTKLIAKRALGPEAKQKHYVFVKQTLRDLQSGSKLWSDISREDWQLVEAEEVKRKKICMKKSSSRQIISKKIKREDNIPSSGVILIWKLANKLKG